MAQGSGWPWALGESVPVDRARRWPKISIVTPSFNQGAYIEETIRSVLLQGYPALEYFVVDGGSTDDTRIVLERYSRWLTSWTSEPDRGQSDAINKGLQHATGDLLAFLNSDDLLEPGALWAVATAYLREASRRMLICGGVSHWRDGAIVYKASPRSLGSLCHWFDEPQTLPQQGCFWTPDVWRLCGPFREDLHLTFDRFFFARVAALDELQFVPIGQYVARFRLHSASKTGRDWERFADEWEAARESLERSLPDVARRRLHRERSAKRYASEAEILAKSTLAQASRAEAAAVLWRGILRNPALLVSRPVMGAGLRLLKSGSGAR